MAATRIIVRACLHVKRLIGWRRNRRLSQTSRILVSRVTPSFTHRGPGRSPGI